MIEHVTNINPEDGSKVFRTNKGNLVAVKLNRPVEHITSFNKVRTVSSLSLSITCYQVDNNGSPITGADIDASKVTVYPKDLRDNPGVTLTNTLSTYILSCLAKMDNVIDAIEVLKRYGVDNEEN